MHVPFRPTVGIVGLRRFLLAIGLWIAGVVLRAATETITVTPAHPGRQLIRVSLPLGRDFLGDQQGLMAEGGGVTTAAGVRVLTRHPGTLSARRAMVSFIHEFRSREPVMFTLSPTNAVAGQFSIGTRCELDGEGLLLRWEGGEVMRIRLTAPRRTSGEQPQLQEIENNGSYRWRRWRLDDAEWPRIIEVREDALGSVTVVAHVQRVAKEDGFAPDLGLELESGSGGSGAVFQGRRLPDDGTPLEHRFGDGAPATLLTGGRSLQVYHPQAPLRRRGDVRVRGVSGGGFLYRYRRCVEGDRVPMQPYAWQRFEIVIAPPSAARLTPSLASPHVVEVDPRRWSELHGGDVPERSVGNPELDALIRYHRDGVVASMVLGDDFGNVTGFQHGSPAGVFGMNRLNHGAPMFESAWRSGDARLLETGLLWCDNFVDQSIWWGPGKTGGTRYNNMAAQGRSPLTREFMWRSNDSVHFCTKGYDALFLAFEETGDPRLEAAFRAQVDYAANEVHADRGECRNIGDVRDFVRLYEWTGEGQFLDEALRLFRELRTKLSTGGLFDQGGKPITPNPPFIENDEAGLKLGYAKPYIIGYALAGLPALARHRPDEPRLREVIQAVADFLAASMDPAGGWRYPHPRSSQLLFSQAIEHAWQLAQADQLLGVQTAHLDAIERVLRARVQGWLATGRILGGLGGWEMATGKVKDGRELGRLYAKPGDRDASRDYVEGRVSIGGAPPEGLVYFEEVLRFYLRHRPASRLLEAPVDQEPLGRILARAKTANEGTGPFAPTPLFHQKNGVTQGLPVFRDTLAGRWTFPMSWNSRGMTNFGDWRRAARAKVKEAMLAQPPSVPFDPVVIAEQERGGHLARQVALNLTGDSRVLALMTLPKGRGPFPAVLLLHDHGAKFDIGKEKMIEPWNVSVERLRSARDWVARYYGGRFLGDELARRGYVCLAVDALNWGDRGGAGYEGQQALAANLLHFGMSHAGLIAWEDLRAAEFLATRPEVDGSRVGAMGLSMGCFRTWQVAALSDHIAAGVAVAWMALVGDLMVPGNNQTRGQSAYTMTHPGLFNHMDYPDVASIACPKTMLFYNGARDPLFPVASAEKAFGKLRMVWESQGAGERLETRIWDVPHEFNAAMQDAAFEWLDRQLTAR